jgi:hypothetical protein
MVEQALVGVEKDFKNNASIFLFQFKFSQLYSNQHRFACKGFADSAGIIAAGALITN